MPITFAGRLKMLREQNRLSKTALAKAVGVSTTCVWNWEEGNTEPRGENLLFLSRALNVTTEYLEFGVGKLDKTLTGLTSENLAAPATLLEVIAEAKMKISKLAIVEPSKVKISIDY